MNIFLGKPPENIKQWIINDYNRKQEEKLKIPLCFEAVDSGATIALKCNGDNLKTASFLTSTDGQNWSDYTFETIITLEKDKKVYFIAKEDNTAIGRDLSNYLQFTTTQDEKKVNVSGNVMSLLAPEFKDLIDLSTIRSGRAGTHLFYELFYGCNNINDCNNLILPATTLADECYLGMFVGCSSLTLAPALPATTLADGCYYDMFNGCSSLTKAPDLPATTLALNCYLLMFSKCASLTQAPAIKTYTPNLYAYESMLWAIDWNTSLWGKLTTCIWNDLTLSEVESMVLRESIFAPYNPGSGVRINITCKDGSGIAYYDSGKSSWVFEY